VSAAAELVIGFPDGLGRSPRLPAAQITRPRKFGMVSAPWACRVCQLPPASTTYPCPALHHPLHTADAGLCAGCDSGGTDVGSSGNLAPNCAEYPRYSSLHHSILDRSCGQPSEMADAVSSAAGAAGFLALGESPSYRVTVARLSSTGASVPAEAAFANDPARDLTSAVDRGAKLAELDVVGRRTDVATACAVPRRCDVHMA
jgi:hypothetical protein